MDVSMTAETFLAILSASGLILVTFANIFYNRHYRDSKQAEIAALKAQIASIEQFTSSHVLDEHTAMKSMLESYIERQKAGIAKLEIEKNEQVAVIAEKDSQTAKMEAQKDKQIAEANVKYRRERLHMLDRQQRTAHAALQLSTAFNDYIAANPGAVLTVSTHDLSSFDTDLLST